MEITLDIQIVLGYSLVLFGVGLYFSSVLEKFDSPDFASHLLFAMIYGGGAVFLIAALYWLFN